MVLADSKLLGAMGVMDALLAVAGSAVSYASGRNRQKVVPLGAVVFNGYLWDLAVDIGEAIVVCVQSVNSVAW